MVKLGFLLLLASASCASVSARFVPPNRRTRDIFGGEGRAKRRRLKVGDFESFDPPIPVSAYLSGTCSADQADAVFDDKISSIRVLGEDEFCIGGLVLGDDGGEITTYDLMDEITCTPWGVYDRYSACTDATCSDCIPSTVSYYGYDEFRMTSVEGVCFQSTYSFDPTSFFDVQPVSFMFRDDAHPDDAGLYIDTIASNSCIGGDSEEGEMEEEDEDDCLSIPDLVCSMDGFTVVCDFFTALATDSPEVYYAASLDPMTLFAPRDEAFGDIQVLFDDLSDEDAASVFFFHATGDVLTSDDLRCSTLIEMSDGGLSRTICKNGEFIQKGGGNRKNDLLPIIEETDITACNGIIHVVSEVMLPNFIDEF